MAKVTARGSAKLPGRVVPLTSADVRKVMNLARLEGVRLIDWTDHGTPRPELVSGTFHVSAGSVPRLVAEVLKFTAQRPRLRLFPRGIPFPDIFEVNVELGKGVH